MPHDHWREYHTRWKHLEPPLRPDANVVDAVRGALREHAGRTLLLGVTPELADVAADVTAVDRSDGMIGAVWPGNTAHRRALNGDWRALPFAARHFDAVVGDGSMNVGTYPADYGALLGELARVLRPGGRAVFRVFERPDTVETMDAVMGEARSRRIASFHAFKWKLAMARVAEIGTPNIAVQEILAALDRHAPDRAGFAEAAGWPLTDVDTIDVYRGSAEVYSFPSRSELVAAFAVAAFGAPRFVSVSGYPLAERCPLVVADRAPD